MEKCRQLSSDELMSYRLAAAVIETIARENGLSEREKKSLLDTLRKLKNIDKNSIFAI